MKFERQSRTFVHEHVRLEIELHLEHLATARILTLQANITADSFAHCHQAHLIAVVALDVPHQHRL